MIYQFSAYILIRLAHLSVREKLLLFLFIHWLF